MGRTLAAPGDVLDQVRPWPAEPAKTKLTRLEILALVGFILLASGARFGSRDYELRETVASWARFGNRAPGPSETVASDGAAYNPETNRWRVMATPRLAGRSHPAAVWTGKEMLVWGGLSDEGYLDDGAAYNPKTDRWTPLPPSHLSARSQALAAWTGREFLIFGGHTREFGGRPEKGEISNSASDGAAYDPVKGIWRKLQPSDLPMDTPDSPAVWTGRELIVIVPGGERASDRPDEISKGAAYNPKTNRWADLPPIPLKKLLSPAAVWTGEEMVIVSQSGFVAYCPRTKKWRTLLDLNPLRLPEEYPPVAVWTGEELLIWVWAEGDGQSAGAAYNPTTNIWRVVNDSSLGGRIYPTVVWTSTEMIAWGGQSLTSASISTPGAAYVDDGAAYNPAADRWESMPSLPLRKHKGRAFPAGVFTGEEMLVWGGAFRFGMPQPREEPAKVLIGEGKISPVRRWQLFAWKKAYEWVCAEIKEPGAVRGREECLPPRRVGSPGLFLGGGKREVPWDYPVRD
ncbi:MAG: Kelch repeat-containing protein, partial [Actinomycetota bacterium]